MQDSSILSEMPILLGDNLRLRFATPADAEALAELSVRIFEEVSVGAHIRELMSGAHPTVRASDFTVVEDMNTEKIVSTLCLISQTWTYSGIPFKLGQPEFVITEPEYRRRGLVRKQFEVIHALSAARGELMQSILGIPWYYRLFGYEMAMDVEAGQSIDGIYIPMLKTGETETCRLRPHTEADTLFIQKLYADTIKSQVFACPRSSTLWDYEFNGRSAGSEARRKWLIIEDIAGERLGYVQHVQWCCDTSSDGARSGANFGVTLMDLKPGVGYLQLMRSLLRALWEEAQRTPMNPESEVPKVTGIQFMLGREHPAYQVLPQDNVRKGHPYAWYIRVPNLITFLQHIRPALERHLIGTVAEGYTGALKLNLYRSGIRFTFERGRITEIAEWSPADVESGDAAFPELTFLQLLCGRCRTAELEAAFVDCWTNNTATAVLLDRLFPPFTSNIWSVDQHATEMG